MFLRLLRVPIMKIKSSLKSIKKEPKFKVGRRRGRYKCKQPKFKARQK